MSEFRLCIQLNILLTFNQLKLWCLQYLAGVTVPASRSPTPSSIEFNRDGSLKHVELKASRHLVVLFSLLLLNELTSWQLEQVMNLRPPNEATHSNWWEEIGVWKSENGGKVKKIPFF